MPTKYRLGALGFAHMHINGLLRTFAPLPNVEWVAAADNCTDWPSRTEKPSGRIMNLRNAVKNLGIPKVYDDYKEMLAKEEFDVIIACPENAIHGAICEEIAKTGAIMVTEKPMSASLSDALRGVRACQRYGTEFIVNWPTTWRPNAHKVAELIKSGLIGEVWEVKWRNGASLGPLSYSTGAEAWEDGEKGEEWWHHAAPGGGALLDYCCYGACAARWFIGEPATAAFCLKANMNSHYGDADDNAVITARFPRAMAVLEGTWTTWHMGVRNDPVIYGRKGTLVMGNKEVDGKRIPTVEVFTTHSHGWSEPDEVIECGPLPAGRATLGEEVIHHLETGEPLWESLQMQFNLEAMAILDAGIRSAASGKMEICNTVDWCIG